MEKRRQWGGRVPKRPRLTGTSSRGKLPAGVVKLQVLPKSGWRCLRGVRRSEIGHVETPPSPGRGGKSAGEVAATGMCRWLDSGKWPAQDLPAVATRDSSAGGALAYWWHGTTPEQTRGHMPNTTCHCRWCQARFSVSTHSRGYLKRLYSRACRSFHSISSSRVAQRRISNSTFKSHSPSLR